MAQIKTNPEEFLRFDKILRLSIPDYEPFYFKLNKKEKDPWAPKGAKDYSWKDGQLTTDEAVEAMKAGYNIGIAATEEDPLVIIDIDDPEAFTDFDFTNTLMARSGGRIGQHAFYFTHDQRAKVMIPIEKEGEIRSKWAYVVAPGSYAEIKGKWTPKGRILKSADEIKEAIPEHDRGNAGKYELINDKPLIEITYDGYPERFRTVYEANIEADKAELANKQERENHDYHQGDGKTGFYDITIEDILTHVPDKARFPSYFHGSSTGKNSSISNGELHHCWRCNVSHNGIQALGVISGMYTCADAGKAHTGSGAGLSRVNLQDGETVYKLWQYAKENNYLPKDDPIPSKALHWYALDKGYCKESDVKDGWRVPGHAYIKVLKDFGLLQERQETKTQVEDDPDKPCKACRFYRDGINDKGHEWAKCALYDVWLNPYRLKSCNDWEEKKETPKAKSTPLQGRESPYFDFRNKFMTKKFADETLDQFHIITLNDTKEMGVYRDGVYVVEGGEDTVRRYCLEKLGDDFKRDRIAEVVEYIKLKTLTPRDVLNKVTWKINVKNGMYDVDNDRLLPHSPEYFSTIQLPVHYDPEAQCMAVDKFMYEVVTPEDVLTLVQYAGYCCTTDISQQRAVIVDGEGNNGKTVFVELVCALIGQSNVSEQRLQDLNNDRFSRAQLNGKLLNMFPDLPKTKLYDNSVFKMLTSDQWIDGEEKYIRKFRFRNTTKQLYSANKIPEVDDPDELAFFRRWISITFPESFEGRENKNLLSELTTEKELSGFFNIAMVGLRALREHDKFCYNKSVSDVQKIYLVKSDPVQAFLDNHVEVSDMNLLKTELYESFEAYCENNKITNYPKPNVFGRKMKKIGYDTGRLSDISRSYVWQNIGLKTEGKKDGQKNLCSAYVPELTQTAENKVTDSDKKSSCLGYLGYSSIVVKYNEFYKIIYCSLYNPLKGFQNNLGNLDRRPQNDNSSPDYKKKEPRQNLGSQAERLNKLKPAVNIYERQNRTTLNSSNYRTFAAGYVQNNDMDYEQVLSDLKHDWNISDNDDGVGKMDKLVFDQTAEPVTTIRALQNIPVFAGKDGTVYELKIGDIVTIPTVHSKGLIKGKAAVEVLEVPA